MKVGKFQGNQSLDKELLMPAGEESSPSPSDDGPPYWVVQCRAVSLETMYTQTTKTDSVSYISIYLCTRTRAHTHTLTYVTMQIKERISMKVLGSHDRNLREGSWDEWEGRKGEVM